MTIVNNKPAQTAGSPASAQPIAGLSKRAQMLLDPRKNGHFRSAQIEPRESGIARQAKTKASI